MEILPAIDLKGGKCVRLTQGKFEQQNLYSDDPLTIAKRWVTEGATRLHIIDLDGARTGMVSPPHLVLVRDIIRRLKVPVQMGGGMRSREVIERVLNAGVDRVIVGTAAVTDPLIGEIFRTHGQRIAVGIDARGGMVAVNGWLKQTETPALKFAEEMEKLGASRIIFTDISRDGMLEGVNLAAVQSIIRQVRIPVVAAGGVATLQDITDLMAIGADGVVLGKSLYENKILLPDAIRAVQGRGGASMARPAASPQPNAMQRPAPPMPPAPPGPPKPYMPWANPPKK